MIVSFADRETERVWEGGRSRRLPGDIQATAMRRLRSLDAAEHLDDLRLPPGNRLEALLGDRLGQHSMRINQQWRLCFRWSGGHAYDVEICDYH
ncbi:type II toxin-antitoxin system RelE/ParE family toxin [Caulobacter sp. SSI4214]|uniref:type II toxin-antitoxin system RelE/ParE family toxin n=1 Tax=Caulobacter sp. SSI4214 TaxID=2575739 RepID=UPI00143C8156|nr:type II toxin-antitoxin system RelE/ParE family toxin [Caulobacter sp. SSI4214]